MKNHVQLFCLKKKNHLCIYFWLHWVFVAVWAFSNWGERRRLFVEVHRLRTVVVFLVSKYRC